MPPKRQKTAHAPPPSGAASGSPPPADLSILHPDVFSDATVARRASAYASADLLLFPSRTETFGTVILEALASGIPVVAVLDSNVSPDGIAFPVPGNDDASRAIRLYCEAIAIAATRGGREALMQQGYDFGAAEQPPVEEAVEG